MSFLSTLFDFMFPLKSTSYFSAEEEPLGSGNDSNDMIAINPATAMPMLGGIGGIDLMGNLWGQSDSMGSGGSCFSTDCTSDLFDCGSMLDAGSMFDSCSMFD